MAKKKLSPAAEAAAGLIRAHPDEEVEAAHLERQMGKQRWEIVALLKELDAAGLGRFIAGRHGYETRFAKAFAADTYVEGSPVASNSDDHHVLVLKRDVPFKVALPADLSRLEADKIMRWVDALPDN